MLKCLAPKFSKSLKRSANRIERERILKVFKQVEALPGGRFCDQAI